MPWQGDENITIFNCRATTPVPLTKLKQSLVSFMLVFALNGCILLNLEVPTSTETDNEILFSLPRLTLWCAHYSNVFPRLIA